jgi:hypothetical protein
MEPDTLLRPTLSPMLEILEIFEMLKRALS